MPKKYIQVLLSINFCLTAMTAIANSDSDSTRSFEFISDPDTDSTRSFEIMHDESLNNYIDPFNQIWDCLDNIKAFHSSKLLRIFIEQYKENIAKPSQDERLKEFNQKDFEYQLTQLNISLGKIRFNYQTERKRDETELNTQIDKIEGFLETIYNNYLHTLNTPKEKVFLKQQLEHLQVFLQNFSSPLAATLSNQFYHIWKRLDKVNALHPSGLLQSLLEQHKEDMKRPIPSNEMLQKVSQEEFEYQFWQINESLKIYESYQIEEVDKKSKGTLKTQFNAIKDRLKTIYEIYEKESLLNADKVLFKYQLTELQHFLERFIEENKNQINPESSLVEWKGPFNQIWNCLNEINAYDPSELLQRLILQHEKDMQNPIPYAEIQEEINKEELDNQFDQLFSTLKDYSKSQETKDELITQCNQIEKYLDTIHNIYDFKKELSKEEKAFLKYQLTEIHVFLQNLITEKVIKLIDFEQENLKIPEIELRKTQELLENCQKEDSAIYAQYEPLINNEEIHSLDFLIDSETEKRFLYFNQSEGLIEIQHKDENEEIYTTTWKIGEADSSYMKNWGENDPITIQKTGLLSKYSMSKYLLGESLEYTFHNKGKTSVRANFVCKSSQKNTYTILSIDYHENVVILKNGPCLFIQGNLNNWHIEDKVTLYIIGSTLDPKRPHKLINKTRPGKVSCSLRTKK